MWGVGDRAAPGREGAPRSEAFGPGAEGTCRPTGGGPNRSVYLSGGLGVAYLYRYLVKGISSETFPPRVNVKLNGFFCSWLKKKVHFLKNMFGFTHIYK